MLTNNKINYTERQMEILNSALNIISERGIENLTMKNIGEELNISDAALYKHFKRKNEIFYGIASIFETESNEILQGIINKKMKCVEKIRTFYLNRIEKFANNKSTTVVLFSSEIIDDDRFKNKIFNIMKIHKKLIMGEIKKGQRKNEIANIDPEHLFNIIMGSLRLMVEKWRLSGFKFDLKEEAAQMWKSLSKILKK
ncbi:MAG: TetR/AcrR family transcriptional regulator [Candidatus Mcinerneyibacterium aminivorans]|uniref:TetR/AcrR family transcriptional regulator n=1 Tax=Candidatus Mcinerneyibacterium aminivorans TaxID=2703815 RepID=A0A5D0ME95_9BACT|nr:MAG: TetR/AcrR family transcriptional regulator [Candidatus Mcinerneyibacterium aminivorans]